MFNIYFQTSNFFTKCNFHFKHPLFIRCIHGIAHYSSNLDSNQLLSELSKNGRVDEARKLFDQMPYRDKYTWNIMISAYANLGNLVEARKLFNETPIKNSITWSSLVSGYCKNGCEVEGLRQFSQMWSDGQKPSQYTLGSVLRACSTLSLLHTGKMIHCYAIKIQLEANIFVATGLVDMYSKCKCLLEAEYLFFSLPDRKNYVQWTAMLTGYAQNGESLKAIQCFKEMRNQGMESNHFTFPSILTACTSISAYAFGRQVHGCIIWSGFGPNVYVQSALVDMYAKCGDLASARMILDTMEIDDVVCWNSMIVGCVTHGYMEEALVLFHKMHNRDIRIDDFTYPSVLKSLASCKNLKIGESVHSLTIKTGFDACKTVSNALVDMYAKQGNLSCALDVFNKILDKDVISWTSLVTGYVHNGFHEKALQLFCDMRTARVDLDQFVVACVFSACAELTVIEFGRQVHANFIKSSAGSLLSAENSLITMYAKCGCLEDAIRVFDSMETRNVISWTAIIVGYAQNGRGKDSLHFYEQMIIDGIKPDGVTFIGLLFACSHAGLVETGQSYFESMEKVYGIKPASDHYACMIDLLGRAGKINEAEHLLNRMDVEPDATIWKSLLSACRVHGNLELGERAGKNLIKLEPSNSLPYVLLSNMFSVAGRWEDAAHIRRAMKTMGINKEPGYSWIEMKSQVHTFISEDRSHPLAAEIYSKIDEMMILIKEAGHVPDMNFALRDMDEEAKERSLAYHSEKLAVAFGLLTVAKGAPIRIFKNLRVCGDCHSAMKYISSIFKRHIILRDLNCFHHFIEGKCSCGDFW
ncbi:pentatricopeptide repeat-containing protein At2g03880, mitochondrial isoform X1 [Cucumis sativus]|uniref:pentatricopeptide repeat-containing protein At2g03880, mitochondrial isoform X1 n=1 Tax=Cucumis sativus TaxID=3659 RepID=UPI0005ECE70C|nr:pentatricopeptide repeat-containing protein At2g03880, mitochondrial isoform X1 [Cucumis sativus]XP_011653925.1 pentatricopeptide repeat-containing protein At2g03880, mitochondrial isoform X1 [Cucumis sativus]XP_011653926.1 pentatricopeptide repeat-containing protein At2g03880, mitochondrial isoform X1 [Cucumis sativus]XP_011653927.1 pentatricopeptide repeat-containing protein At2g03880, mitochondrial isoform X1 [Cucumis sativus]XP_031740527.1 pentatricopeptide repeat-containing protein At2g